MRRASRRRERRIRVSRVKSQRMKKKRRKKRRRRRRKKRRKNERRDAATILIESEYRIQMRCYSFLVYISNTNVYARVCDVLRHACVIGVPGVGMKRVRKREVSVVGFKHARDSVVTFARLAA